MVTEALEDAAHDAVAARVDLDAGLIAVFLCGVADSVGVDGTILKLDTVGDTLHIFLADIFVTPHVVNLFLDKLGVCELRGEVAVVGEQKHTCGVAVETSYGIDAFVAGALDEVHDCEATVGVVACSHAVLGLVEQDVALALEGNYLAVILDCVVVRNLGAELGNDLVVDLDKTLLDVFVGLATRAKTGIGKELIKTYLLVGIGDGHLILDALGKRSEALAGTHALIATVVKAVVVAALLVVIAALTVIVVVTSLAVVIVTTLTVVVISTLTIVVVTALLVVIKLARLIAALLTVIVVTTLLVIVKLAGLIAALLTVVVTALAIIVVATLAIVVILTGLITAFARLISTLARLESTFTGLCSAVGQAGSLSLGRRVALSIVAAVIVVIVIAIGTLAVIPVVIPTLAVIVTALLARLITTLLVVIAVIVATLTVVVILTGLI